jgi:hypothetical protein
MERAERLILEMNSPLLAARSDNIEIVLLFHRNSLGVSV